MPTRPQINPKPAGCDRGRPAAPVPHYTPCFTAEWVALGLDSEPMTFQQLAYGTGAGDRLAAALAAGQRAGDVIGVGLVVDRRTGEQIYPVVV